MRINNIIYSITVLLIISPLEIESGFLSFGQKNIPFTKRYAIATVSFTSAFILFWILNKRIVQNPIRRYHNLQEKLANLEKQKKQLQESLNPPASKKTGVAFQLNREKAAYDINNMVLLIHIEAQIQSTKYKIQQLRDTSDFLRSYKTPPRDTLRGLMADAAEKRRTAATTPATKQ